MIVGTTLFFVCVCKRPTIVRFVQSSISRKTNARTNFVPPKIIKEYFLLPLLSPPPYKILVDNFRDEWRRRTLEYECSNTSGNNQLLVPEPAFLEAQVVNFTLQFLHQFTFISFIIFLLLNSL